MGFIKGMQISTAIPVLVSLADYWSKSKLSRSPTARTIQRDCEPKFWKIMVAAFSPKEMTHLRDDSG
jgi:hypothetical protein